ncbi:MAG: prolyl oligopeptidase family serine peptidase [Burkholderiales bacterium]|nr:prolyl oligopeptidase family serine peptidase [Burkholderiales bacterium]
MEIPTPRPARRVVWSRPDTLRRFATGLCLGLWAFCAAAQATVGMAVMDGRDGKGPITVYYPSSSPGKPLMRGPVTLDVAWQGSVQPGNRRLVLISHGSGGAPWPFADLARVLVNAGFVVAVPEHDGDNYHDRRLAGPDSWKRRPAEASAAIDALKADARLGPVLDVDRVGVYGTSAGGLTALTLAGASWSPANLMRHCLAHMEEDFPGCVGLTMSLRGNYLDQVKLTAARWFHLLRFDDETRYSHNDPRIRAVIASVPMATPIDMTTMAQPRIAVGLMIAEQDRWLAPRFHVKAVRAACAACEVLADLPDAGHGSFLSPWPADFAKSITPLLADPPGFARQDLPAVYAKMAGFFSRHLLARQ